MSIHAIYTGAPNILAAGITGNNAATKYLNFVNGAPTIDPSVVSGGPSWKFVAAATLPWVSKNSGLAGATYSTFRGQFQVTDATPSSDMVIATGFVGAGSDAQLLLLTSGVLQMKMGASTQNGPTLADNALYAVEWEIDTHANPNVVKWRTRAAGVGGTWTDRTNVSVAQAATSVDGNQWGIVSGPTSGVTLYWADVALGSAASSTDYPATGRDRFCGRLLPNADGTHSFTAADFGYNAAGGAVAGGATDVYSYLDDSDQTSLSDFIRQAVARSTSYVEIQFADAPGTHVPIAVGITATQHASGTTANNASIAMSDDAFVHTNTVIPLDDVSDTTAHYQHVVMPTKPSDSGAWTWASLNALRARLGYSTNIASVPYWDSISLTYLYEVTATVGRSPYAGGGFYP